MFSELYYLPVMAQNCSINAGAGSLPFDSISFFSSQIAQFPINTKTHNEYSDSVTSQLPVHFCLQKNYVVFFVSIQFVTMLHIVT